MSIATSKFSIKKLAVIGIGRVGLPLSLVLANEGFEVTGVDRDESRLNSLLQGKVPFLEEGADEILKKVYGTKFHIVHEEGFAGMLPNMDAIILTLGTTIDNTLSPSISQVTDFFAKFETLFRKDQLIVLRSTVSPGTTEFIKNFLKNRVGLEVGKDIFLAYCPERIAEGHAIKELYEIPQAIGTFDEASKIAATSIFKKLTNDILYTDPLSAELSKLYCNMYRYIDFAIGNEFMLIADSHGRNIYEILKLVNDGYKRGGVKSPGFTAGACLVKDGFFLMDKSPYLDLVTAAWRVNESIPGFLIEKLKREYGGVANKKVAVLGLGFKKNTDDTRYSLSLKLQNYLVNEGAIITIHDPYIKSQSIDEALKDAEVVILAVNHDVFKKLDLKMISKLVKKDCIICDIWNMFRIDKIVYPLKEAENLNKSVTPRNGIVKIGMASL